MVKAKLLGSVYALATLAVLAPGMASAQPADKRTFFTFSGKVEMPGVALPAGKYEFRIINPDTSRNVIQVRSGDGKKNFGLFATHSAQRVTAADEAEVRFLEAGAGAPPAIKTWWYPGERTGYEFVYPKAQARRLAQRTRQPVPDDAERDGEHEQHERERRRTDAHLPDRKREPGERERSGRSRPRRFEAGG